MYIFSAATCSFYPLEMKDDYISAGSWPDDGINVEDNIFNIYAGQPPEGKQRGASPDGLPCWIDIPPLTAEQLRAKAARQQSSLLDAAGKVIAPLQDADDLGIATTDELEKLKRWKIYRVQLNRLNPEDAPNIHWPLAPEA
ncbi:tail fiber assembly protein [Serratia rubidaea]|uniref:tail fiber assembly protein n=1 Tax=Serratia rubidaea TaxID=61652 RepID=UPI000772F93F|nr:tail fiber assembly protein [Serratia rubidaea]